MCKSRDVFNEGIFCIWFSLFWDSSLTAVRLSHDLIELAKNLKKVIRINVLNF